MFGLQKDPPKSLEANIRLIDADGRPTDEFERLQMEAVEVPVRGKPDTQAFLAFYDLSEKPHVLFPIQSAMVEWRNMFSETGKEFVRVKLHATSALPDHKFRFVRMFVEFDILDELSEGVKFLGAVKTHAQMADCSLFHKGLSLQPTVRQSRPRPGPGHAYSLDSTPGKKLSTQLSENIHPSRKRSADQALGSLPSVRRRALKMQRVGVTPSLSPAHRHSRMRPTHLVRPRKTTPFHKPVRRELSAGVKKKPYVQSKLRFSASPLTREDPLKRALAASRETFRAENEGRSAAGVGFVNRGNNCYVNAVLQALFATPGFLRDLRGSHARVERGENPDNAEQSFYGCVLDAANRVRAASGAIDVGEVKRRIAGNYARFSTNSQQDAHEFFSGCLNQLNADLGGEDEKRPATAELTPIDTVFRCDLEYCLTCPLCGYSRESQEKFFDLSLDLPPPPPRPAFGAPRPAGPRLETLLRAFFTQTVLRYNCPSCTSKEVQAQYRLVRAPRTLVLHLKRFQPDRAHLTYCKRRDPVQIPLELDLTFSSPAAQAKLVRMTEEEAALKARVQQERDVRKREELELKLALLVSHNDSVKQAPRAEQYSLRCIVKHRGRSARSGHYVADVRRETNWVRFDDTRVRELTEDYAVRSGDAQEQAYVLLYSQRV